MNQEKEKIRQDAIKHRDKFEKSPDMAEEIVQRFFEAFPELDNQIVALYWPIKSEMDTSPLIEELLRRNIQICLPKTEKGNAPLTFLKWDGKEPLVKSGFGTVAPEDKETNRTKPDIIIVPLVAFDRYGTRLGYGKGHYDMTLSKLKDSGHGYKTVGYAYDQQICLFPLPKEPHDQRLDMVLTPSQIY